MNIEDEKIICRHFETFDHSYSEEEPDSNTEQSLEEEPDSDTEHSLEDAIDFDAIKRDIIEGVLNMLGNSSEDWLFVIDTYGHLYVYNSTLPDGDEGNISKFEEKVRRKLHLPVLWLMFIPTTRQDYEELVNGREEGYIKGSPGGTGEEYKGGVRRIFYPDGTREEYQELMRVVVYPNGGREEYQEGVQYPGDIRMEYDDCVRYPKAYGPLPQVVDYIDEICSCFFPPCAVRALHRSGCYIKADKQRYPDVDLELWRYSKA